MELQSGLPLVIQQWKALLRKNYILAWRNRRSTFCQLLSPFFFFLMLFVILRQYDIKKGKSVTHPAALVSPPIPACEDKVSIRRPCFDFVWSGNGSAPIASIVTRIMENNPGRPISPSKVKSFSTKTEVDEWLYNEPLRCPGALHFEVRSETIISYGIQTNSTQSQKGGEHEDPTFKFQIPLQLAAEREIARALIGDPNFIWVVGLKEFAHPALRVSAFDEEMAASSKDDIMEFIAPIFFLATAMFGFVFQIRSLVREKELKLRQAMTTMGLYDTAYWLSWLSWEAMLALFSSLLIVLCGMMLQFPLFLRNSFAILFLVFFLFQLSMIGFAFMLSTIIGKSSSSLPIGFCVFIASFVAQLIQLRGFPYDKKHNAAIIVVWLLYPPNLLHQALLMLINAVLSSATSNGISWSKRSECSTDSDSCPLTINSIFMWFVKSFFLWVIMAIYLDNIVPNPAGVRKSIFYFVNPGYWTGRGGSKVKDDGIFSCLCSGLQLEHKDPNDEDVFEEEKAVKQQVREGINDPNVVVQIQGLAKTYTGMMEIGFCKCKRKSHYHAVKGLWVNIQKDQLFCLLGPNGAGKTTTISCLTGIAPVTSGDALIYGHSIRSSTGISNIRKIIGVCPQFDILWDALSGEEHLNIFAGIKGLPAGSINMVARTSLAEVRLTKAAKVRAGSYSGGMRRRLSVAIALVGDPKLVILDEPTTGMDPISRRHVWDIIENAKKGRAIILTTHSMEEADILGDRIGIMAKGMLRCLGTSIRLKSRFGSGLVINVSFSETTTGTGSQEDLAAKSRHEDLKNFFHHHLDIVPKQETKYYLSYVIPQNKESLLKGLFAELQKREGAFDISDIQLGLTTLEEVFLNVARKAALENALDENNLVTLTLAAGTELLIPVGAKHVGIPGTASLQNPIGLMVEVHWGQDSDGNLCITGHSDETPIPNIIGQSVPPTPPTRGPVHGIVLDV